MKVILTFLMATFLVAVWASNRSRPSRAWLLAVVSLFVGALFLKQRFI
jgi:hypothetical protein